MFFLHLSSVVFFLSSSIVGPRVFRLRVDWTLRCDLDSLRASFEPVFPFLHLLGFVSSVFVADGPLASRRRLIEVTVSPACLRSSRSCFHLFLFVCFASFYGPLGAVFDLR